MRVFTLLIAANIQISCGKLPENNEAGTPFHSTITCDEADFIIRGETVADHAFTISTSGDINNDSKLDIFIGAHGYYPEDNDPISNPSSSAPGASYLLRGPVNEGVSLSDYYVKLDGTDGRIQSGRQVAILEDRNSDEASELLVAEAGSSEPGAILLFLSPFSGELNSKDRDYLITHETESELIFAVVTDFNGDAMQDIAVGVPTDGTYDNNAGTIYLLTDISQEIVYLETAAVQFYGETTFSYAGNVLSGAGDVNADGYGDLLIGAPSTSDTDHKSPTVVYLIYGPREGVFELSSADARLFTSENHVSLISISPPGDINGDGIDDVTIGYCDHEYDPSHCVVFSIFGPVFGEIGPDDADIIITQESHLGGIGRSISTLSDLNGDGCDELLVGEPSHDYNDEPIGRVALFYSPLFGEYTTDEAAALFIGNSKAKNFGINVVDAGDIDSNGLADVVIASNEDDYRGGLYFFLATTE